jgi:hypothetical protein
MQQPLINKIVSGGQTGADRAALDAAVELGRSYGGWLPRGRKTEDGPLPLHYEMQEMASRDYRKRTEKNVVDSDGTLIVSHGALTRGSLLTLTIAEKRKRPYLHIDYGQYPPDKAKPVIEQWLRQNSIRILNVAGPRGSGDPAIYDVVRKLVGWLLRLQAG